MPPHFLISVPELGIAKKKLDLEIDGYIISGLKVESFKNGEINHLGKIDFETKRNKGIKAAFSVRFESEDDEAEVRKAVVNKKLEDDQRLEFGFGKKRFGLEYQGSRPDRWTISRSPLYRRLEVFTYAGRETQLRWYSKRTMIIFPWLLVTLRRRIPVLPVPILIA